MPLELIPNRVAAEMLSAEVGGRNFIYWLADNRRGDHAINVPYTIRGRRVFYARHHIDALTRWFNGIDNEPLFLAVPAAGKEEVVSAGATSSDVVIGFADDRTEDPKKHKRDTSISFPCHVKKHVSVGAIGIFSRHTVLLDSRLEAGRQIVHVLQKDEREEICRSARFEFDDNAMLLIGCLLGSEEFVAREWPMTAEERKRLFDANDDLILPRFLSKISDYVIIESVFDCLAA